MADLPSGTVTLLFSDMEGSTTLVRELGEAWPEVLQRQRDLARDAWAKHGGHELGTEGDSFFVVFTTPAAAAAAALDLQRALTSAVWPHAGGVRVRIGIHTGSPQRHADGYVGLDVHKAARVAGSAHGGQVVISDPAAQLLVDALPADVALRDLGVHRLKDIPSGVRLHQLVVADLNDDFPALKTLGGVGSLPSASSPILGRDSQIAEVVDLLGASSTRLVTLTGSGGSGKTRLATAVASAVAHHYDDGVFFVSLASVTNADGIWTSIADALDVPSDECLPPLFFTHVAQRRTLLVLDNLEQIPDAPTVVHQLLDAARHLSVLATSRRPLHLASEFDHQVLPLALPDAKAAADFDQVSASPAVQMFCERARRVRASFDLTPDNVTDVATICRALDGLPLAIEIAAARTKLLSAKAIAGRVGRALDLTSGDRTRESRQLTIRGAIAWSYDMLTSQQQDVLQHLGVFEGDVDLDAIAAVGPVDALDDSDLADVLFDLADASLVTITESDDGEPRFGLLQTVQHFALDALGQTSRYDSALVAHAQYYYDLASSIRLPAAPDPQQVQRMRAELGNLHAILERGAFGVVDALDGGLPVPPGRVAAMLVGCARAIERFGDVITLIEAADRLPHDALGEARCRSFGAYARMMLADQEGALREARRALKGVEPLLEESRSEPSGVSWPDPIDVAVDALAVEVDVLVWGGDTREAETLATRASELVALRPTSRLQAEVHNLNYQIAYFRNDFDEARRELEMTYGRRDPSLWANNMADIDLRQGRLRDVQERLATAIHSGTHHSMQASIVIAETLAAAVGHEHPSLCARTYGCAQVTRLAEGIPNGVDGDAQDEAALAPIKRLVPPDQWREAFARGQAESLTDILNELADLPPVDPVV